ncbi:concanavalin A-like lectin/glucanase [Crassisporium funariophilum]|nr:concanavalin A-like lectin/glucanase [Crassisporium funariophilum]
MKLSTVALVLVPAVNAATIAPAVVARQDECKTYVVPGLAGGFTERIFTDFKGVKAGDNAEAFLDSNGYYISVNPVDEGPIFRRFALENVLFSDGTLDLKVDKYPGSGYTVGGEFYTKKEFKYASVRTVQKIEQRNATQETDWEILTTTIDKSSKCVPEGIWATNQALNSEDEKTSVILPFTFDPREDFHEYRIDWTARATEFYIDGKKVTEITDNVPTDAGPWMWNAWSNGDPCWSGPPPTADSFTQIQSIDIYIGYTETVSGDGICQI